MEVIVLFEENKIYESKILYYIEQNKTRKILLENEEYKIIYINEKYSNKNFEENAVYIKIWKILEENNSEFMVLNLKFWIFFDLNENNKKEIEPIFDYQSSLYLTKEIFEDIIGENIDWGTYYGYILQKNFT